MIKSQFDNFSSFNQSIFKEKRDANELSMKMVNEVNYQDLSEGSNSTNNYSLSPTNTRVKDETISPLTPSATPTPKHTPVMESAPELAATTAEAPTAPIVSKKSFLDFEDEEEESELRYIAQKLYDQDFVSIKVEEYTQYLASTERENQIVISLYMDIFQWDQNLLRAIRQLCDKLYFKGESQEIDRILKAFSKSYVKQYPKNIFGDDDKIYILCYSLILLNTALHNKVNTRTNRDDFIRNTIRTYNDGIKKYSIRQNMLIERELTKYFDELSKSELLLKTGISNEELFNQQQQNFGSLSRQKSYKPRMSSLTMNNQLNYQQQVASQQRKASAPQLLNRQSFSRERKSTQDPDFNLYEYNHATILRKQRTNNGQLQHTPSSESQGYNPPGLDRRGSYTSTMTAGTNFTDYSELLDTVPSNEAIGFTKALLENGSPKKNLSRSTTNTSALRNTSSLNHLRNNNFSKNLNHFSSMNNINKNQQLGLQNSDNFDYDFKLLQDKCDLELELKGPPYIKEGLMKYRIINNDQAQSKLRLRFKLDNNKWEENFIVVSKGELRLYSFQEKLIKKYNKAQTKLEKNYIKQQNMQFQPPSFGLSALSRKTSINSFAMQSQSSFKQPQENEEVGDGNWLKNSLNLGNYNLCSTFSEIIDTPPPGTTISSSNSNSCYWVLTFPKTKNLPPKQFVFEAGTKEIATEFVNSCNFWGSRISAIPTEEPISSIEFGFSKYLFNAPQEFRKTKIQKWSKTPGGVYLTHLSVYDQFIKLIEYFQGLEDNLREHIIIKAKILDIFKKFRYTSNYKNALINYENKLTYLKNEVNKYKNYLIILAYGLQLRFELNDRKLSKEIRSPDNTTIKEESIDGIDVDIDDDDLEGYDELNTDPAKLEMIKSQIHQVVSHLNNGKNLVFKTIQQQAEEQNRELQAGVIRHDDRSNSVATVTTNNYNRSGSVATITTHNLSKLNSINRVTTDSTTTNIPSPNLPIYSIQQQIPTLNSNINYNIPTLNNDLPLNPKSHNSPEIIEEEELRSNRSSKSPTAIGLSKFSTNDSRISEHDITNTTITTSNSNATSFSLQENPTAVLRQELATYESGEFAYNSANNISTVGGHNLIKHISNKIDEVDEDEEIDLTFEHSNPGRLVIV